MFDRLFASPAGSVHRRKKEGKKKKKKKKKRPPPYKTDNFRSSLLPLPKRPGHWVPSGARCAPFTLTGINSMPAAQDGQHGLHCVTPDQARTRGGRADPEISSGAVRPGARTRVACDQGYTANLPLTILDETTALADTFACERSSSIMVSPRLCTEAIFG